MGAFKKILGSAALIGVAVGGISFLKKRSEERYTEDDIFDDFDDEKVFDIKTDSDIIGNQKVTITFNSKKAKYMANNAADKVLDATDSAKDKIKDTVGEEKYDSAVEKVTTATTFAKEKVSNAKSTVVDKIGEDRIEDAKELLNDAVDYAKDKGSELVTKIKNINNDSDIFDVQYFDDEDLDQDEDLESDDLEDDSFVEDSVQEDDNTDDFLDKEDVSFNTVSYEKDEAVIPEETTLEDEVSIEESLEDEISVDDTEDLSKDLESDVSKTDDKPKFPSFDFLKKPDSPATEEKKDDTDFLDDELDEI